MDANMIITREDILKKYKVSKFDYINKGIESEVFAVNNEQVLKIYESKSYARSLSILKEFYGSINRSLLPFEIPVIHSVSVEGNYCVTFEKRLPGKPMAKILPNLLPDEIDEMLESSLNAQLCLQRIKMPDASLRYRLFDEENLSDRLAGDWNQFICRALDYRVKKIGSLLEHKVEKLQLKIDILTSVFSKTYTGEYTLIHGDYFPGNILINDSRHITSLLDFGIFTMYGDPLYDIATGWVFFDMYDEFKANIRKRYYSMLLKKIGKHTQSQIYAYVLLYSILSCDIYPQDLKGDHFKWCVNNLNDAVLWSNLGQITN
jgi:serine/threonine protein kinase